MTTESLRERDGGMESLKERKNPKKEGTQRKKYGHIFNTIFILLGGKLICFSAMIQSIQQHRNTHSSLEQ